MEGLLSPEAAAQIAFFRTLASDKALQARAEQILAANEEAIESLAALKAQEVKYETMLRDAKAAQADAEAKLRAAVEHEESLKASEKAIGEVSAAVNAEKVAWEAIRQKVDKEQAETHAALTARREALDAAEERFAQQRSAAALRAAEAEKMRADYDAKHARLMRALDLNEDA